MGDGKRERERERGVYLSPQSEQERRTHPVFLPVPHTTVERGSFRDLKAAAVKSQISRFPFFWVIKRGARNGARATARRCPLRRRALLSLWSEFRIIILLSARHRQAGAGRAGLLLLHFILLPERVKGEGGNVDGTANCANLTGRRRRKRTATT